MKKLLLFLAGLLFAVLPSAAQQKVADITDRVVTQSADLTPGYYILNCYYLKQKEDAHTKPNGSVLYTNVDNNRNIQSDAAGFINERNTQLYDNQANYIWQVKQNDTDGSWTIRNIQTNVYFPLDDDKGKNMQNPVTKATAFFTLKDKTGTDDLNRTYSGIVLQTTAANDEGWSVFANYGGSGNPTLSYWTSGGGGEVLFQFVEVQNVDMNIIYPFHTSAAPSDGQFNEKTKWQFLTIKNKYLYYTDENTKIKVTADYSIEDRYLWAFHMNEDGKIVIYNKAAGADKVLAAGEMSGTEGGGTFPNFVSAASIPQNQIAVWDGTKSFSISGKDGFFLYRGDNKTERMNLRTANNTEVLSFWTAGANDGSTFWVLPYVNYTIKYVDENGAELQTSTNASGVAGTNVALSAINGLVPQKAIDNNGNELAIENNNITLPESYDCIITVTYDYPFETTQIVDGNLASDTKWYYLKLNNRYLSYNDVTENYNYKGSNNKEQKYVYSYSSNPLTYGCFWAFVKDGEDLKIYNAATGASMVLASDGSTERDDYPTMMTPNTEGYTDSWHYKVATDPTKFYLFLKGTVDNDGVLYDDDANKLNCYGTSDEGNSKNYLTFSTGAGAYSYFTVEEVDVAATITSVRENQVALSGAVGTLDSDSYAEFAKALDEGTAEGLSKALRIRDITGNKIVFNPQKYYRIYGAIEKERMYINPQDLKFHTQADLAGCNQIMQFVPTATENSYYLKVQGQYIAKTTSNSNLGLLFGLSNDESDRGEFQLIDAGTSAGVFRIKNTNSTASGNTFIFKNYQNIIGWSRTDNGSQWYLVEVPSIDVTISDAGYATVNYPFAVQLPEGLTAYTGTVDANNTRFLLEEITNGAVPANTPFIIEGAVGTHTLTIDYANQDPPFMKGLSGSLLPIEISSEDYVLGTYNNMVGFYKTTSGGALAQNKAYIASTPAIQAVRGFSFSTESDGTTGIENTVTETENEEYYDLQGRRVMTPTKGIYVTKSGKKVLFIK